MGKTNKQTNEQNTSPETHILKTQEGSDRKFGVSVYSCRFFCSINRRKSPFTNTNLPFAATPGSIHFHLVPLSPTPNPDSLRQQSRTPQGQADRRGLRLKRNGTKSKTTTRKSAHLPPENPSQEAPGPAALSPHAPAPARQGRSLPSSDPRSPLSPRPPRSARTYRCLTRPRGAGARRGSGCFASPQLRRLSSAPPPPAAPLERSAAREQVRPEPQRPLLAATAANGRAERTRAKNPRAESTDGIYV